jgi:hypothetical protein
MPVVPAFCDSCGAIFPSGILVENSTHIQFSGGRAGPCPNCGGMGHIPDGIFNIIGSTIKLLTGPQRTIADLNRLASLLNNFQQRDIGLDELADEISCELPDLSIFGNILKNNKNDIYQFIIIILMIIQIIISNYSRQKDYSSIIARDKLVWESIDKSYSKKQNVNIGPKRVKIGRNEPCYCGSGIKYKKCHGRHDQ